MFKKIQDAYGADICLTDTVGDVFLGEDRSKCIVNVIQRQSHREETIPLGSRLQPQPDTPDQLDSEQVARLRAQEARYGATLDNLDPDRPVYSNERELPPHGSQGDDGGISPPSKYPVASSSRAVSVVSKRRSLSLGIRLKVPPRSEVHADYLHRRHNTAVASRARRQVTV